MLFVQHCPPIANTNPLAFLRETGWVRRRALGLGEKTPRYLFQLYSDTGGRVFLNGTEISPTGSNGHLGKTSRWELVPVFMPYLKSGFMGRRQLFFF